MRRAGSTAVQVALGMTVVLGAAAVVIDIGRGRVIKQQLRNASEAAAHAAAAKLDGSTAGMEAARAAAVAVAEGNLAGAEPVALDPNPTNDPAGDVVLGYWDDGVFYPSTTPSETTAVRVVARRPDVSTWLAGAAMGEATVNIGDFAIAQGGGPGAAECPFPLAIPDCELLASADICNAELLLSSARVDNGAWARPGLSQANASYIRASLDPNVCAAANELSDRLTLNNGQVNSAFKELGDAVNDFGTPWIDDDYGVLPPQSTGSIVSPYGAKSLVGQIMVFHDPDNCADTSFVGTHEVVGYATIIIYDVVNQGSNKQIKAKTYCTMSDGVGGGGFFGTLVPPNIVR